MRLILCFLILFSSFLGLSQTENDSLSVQRSTIEKEKKHSPKKAALLSLIPGGGQIYNSIAMPKGKKHAYWKVPLIYAGLGVTGYFAFKNHIAQKSLKEEYLYRVENGTPNPDLPEYFNYDQQGILQLYNTKKRARDLMIFAFIVVYGLNVLDAFATAHFVDFDISKDLSLSVRPKMHDFQTPGIALRLKIR